MLIVARTTGVQRVLTVIW